MILREVRLARVFDCLDAACLYSCRQQLRDRRSLRILDANIDAATGHEDIVLVYHRWLSIC